MFGYVIANLGRLATEEERRYKSCYCGLCRSLGMRHGPVGRATINYDMVFLVLFLSSVYGEGSEGGSERCVVRPLHKHDYWRNGISDYAADMCVVLAYHNFLDDWADERNPLSLAGARLLRRERDRAAARHPAQCESIQACLRELSAMEARGEPNPDLPANCFGRLMGGVFAPRDDGLADGLRDFGAALGKFIYVMDACVDLERDIRRERYNPMIATPSGDFRALLNLLMADCAEKLERLPIRQDRGLIENILYSGVWTRYEASRGQARKGGWPCT